MATYWMVWNKEKTEDVIFDQETDTSQNTAGEFQQMSPANGTVFCGDDSPWSIEKVKP